MLKNYISFIPISSELRVRTEDVRSTSLSFLDLNELYIDNTNNFEPNLRFLDLDELGGVDLNSFDIVWRFLALLCWLNACLCQEGSRLRLSLRPGPRPGTGGVVGRHSVLARLTQYVEHAAFTGGQHLTHSLAHNLQSEQIVAYKEKNSINI